MFNTDLTPVLILLNDLLSGEDIDVVDVKNAIFIVQAAMSESEFKERSEFQETIYKFDDYLPGGKFGPPSGGGGRAA